MTLTLSAPSPRQREFLVAKERYVAYGGARGGGKSWAVRTKAVLMAAKYPGIRILLLRKTFPELRENHILPLVSLSAGMADYNESKKVLSFCNGSRIKFGFCDAQNDVGQYQGQEYDVIFMDEATHFTEYQFNAIKSCMRGVNDFPKRFYLTCNPGGVGHGWVKRLFIDRDYRTGEDGADYRFIPAKVYDNRALMDADPEYVKGLLALPDELRHAWLDGNWDAFTGQFFPEFRREAHVVPPAPLPEGTRVYRAIDYGLDMLACLWIGVEPDGSATVFREVCVSDLIVSEAAELILRNSPEPVYETFAPPDLWGRQRETGKSIVEIFDECGVPTVRAENGRIAGWLCVKEWLRQGAGGPALRISSACPHLIRCITELCYDEHNPCDAAITPHNITHLPDALRYFCAARPLAPSTERREDPLAQYRRRRINQRKRTHRAFS
ncbi:MAG: phage terminase large subunit [Clostridia bacterium]|nr:phage terminase large subunit [Clostridia bacterium]